MSKSDADKIVFILNKHEQACRRLKPVYTVLELAFWISVVLLIIYISGNNYVLRGPLGIRKFSHAKRIELNEWLYPSPESYLTKK